MARIVLADDGIEFDGKTPETRPLGGVESSVVNLTAQLAARGHQVHVRNKCGLAMTHLVENTRLTPQQIKQLQQLLIEKQS